VDKANELRRVKLVSKGSDCSVEIGAEGTYQYQHGSKHYILWDDGGLLYLRDGIDQFEFIFEFPSEIAQKISGRIRRVQPLGKWDAGVYYKGIQYDFKQYQFYVVVDTLRLYTHPEEYNTEEELAVESEAYQEIARRVKAIDEIIDEFRTRLRGPYKVEKTKKYLWHDGKPIQVVVGELLEIF
jgi:hypothetical protein